MKTAECLFVALIFTTFIVSSPSQSQELASPKEFLKDHKQIIKDLQSTIQKGATPSQFALPEQLGVPSWKLRRAEEERVNEILRAGMKYADVIYGPIGRPPRLIGFDKNRKPIYEKPIYGGGDDRKNFDDDKVSPTHLNAAKATLAVVRMNKVTKRADGKGYDLPAANNIGGTGRGLCTPAECTARKLTVERFYDEPTPADCSAFKIGPKLVATAAHCFETQAACEHSLLLTGFFITKTNKTPHLRIPEKNIYQCKKIVARELSDSGADWAVIETDRVIDAPTVSLRRKNDPRPPTGEGVTVIGYPMGLPAKMADGGIIRSFSETFFIANLDTYGGNSGSPVFNSKQLRLGKLLVEGILVRGEDDFALDEPCFASKRCPVDRCKGEDIVYAHFVAPFQSVISNTGPVAHAAGIQRVTSFK